MLESTLERHLREEAKKRKGIRMAGLTEVNATYSDWKTGKKARIPAIRMTL